MLALEAVALALLAITAGEPQAEPPRLLPAGPPPARVVHAFDLSASDLDLRLAATTLQGQINREEGRVYLFYNDPEHGTARFWLDELKRKGYIDDFDIDAMDAYFAQYASEADRVIVYDPAVPDTINVATMIASAEGGMVVAPAHVERFGADKEIVDLRGRWPDGVAAYAWAFDTLWPRMNPRVLASLHPTHAHHQLRDYLVRNRIFTFYIPAPDADPALTERGKALMARVFRAAGPNTPVIGWWDGGHLDHGLTEYGGVGWAGRFGMLTVGSNWQDNASLLSGIPAPLDAIARRFRARPTPATPTLEPDKVYLCFAVMESGDAPSYWPHVQKSVWDDPQRGAIPIGWTINPLLLEFLPSVGEWFVEQAGPNDCFAMAISGPGYVHPYRDFMADAAEPEAAWRDYLNLTDGYMQRWGLSDLALYTDAWLPFDRARQDPVTRRFTQGLPGLRMLILGMGRDEAITETSPHYELDGVFVSHIFTRWDAANIGRGAENNRWLADEIRKHAPPERPGFMFVHPLSWSYHPSDLVAVMELLGDDYVAVGPASLMQLWKTAESDKETTR